MAIKSFYDEPDSTNTVLDAMIIGKQDKRKFARMNIESEVSFSRPGSGETFIGTTKDLSATGIRFITKTPIEIGETLDISIKPGIDITPPLDTVMAVVRVNVTHDGDYDVAGVMRQAEA